MQTTEFEKAHGEMIRSRAGARTADRPVTANSVCL